MDHKHQTSIEFTRAVFAALRTRAPYSTELWPNALGGTFFVLLDATGNDITGSVRQVRREPGCTPLVGTAAFRRRLRFDYVEHIELHGTATEIGDDLANYAITHGATPARDHVPA